MVRSIFMNRSILMSIAVIGAAIALVGGGGAFSAFSDTDIESGAVTAGNVDINVNGEGPVSAGLAFGGGAGCPGPIAPGVSCTATATVTNTGSLPVTLGVPALTPAITTPGEGACSAIADWTVSAGAYAPDGTLTAAGGGDVTATSVITATLDADAADGCQGAVLTVTVSVTATNP